MTNNIKVNSDDYFLNSTGQDLVYKQPPKWTKVLIWSIAGSFGFGLIFSCIARIDEVVITRQEKNSMTIYQIAQLLTYLVKQAHNCF